MSTIKSRKLINLLDGQIKISENLTISQKTVPSEIIEYFTSDILNVLDIKNGWIHYTIGNLEIQDKYFNFRFIFLQETLKMISFTFREAQTIEVNWTNKEDEKRQKIKYDNWLNDEIGRQRKFDWGMIESNFDNKGGFSSIMMNYI